MRLLMLQLMIPKVLLQLARDVENGLERDPANIPVNLAARPTDVG
jgi:hypothetical protein